MTLPISWEICMQVKKQQSEPYTEQLTSSKSGKEYVKAVYCHPAYLTYMQSTSCKMQNAGLDDSQPGIKIVGRSINNLRYADDTLVAETEEELKSLLMRVKEKSEKAGLKLNIQKTKIMAFSPITSLQIDGGKVETMTDFIFLGSKSTADGDYSHKIKKHLLLGRKAMTNLDSILKSRHITLLTKIRVVWAMVSPVVMDGCELDRKEDWAPKNWCLQTVVLGKTLESPLDRKQIKPVSRKGNQPWIFRTDAEAEAPILWPPVLKSSLIGKDPDVGEGWRQEEKGETEDKMVGWHHQLNEHEFEQTPGDSEGQGKLACCSSWSHKQWLSDWTTTHYPNWEIKGYKYERNWLYTCP